MKLYAKIAMISCAASLALVACSKNNPPETNPQPEAAPAAAAPAPAAAPAAPAVNEDSLAAERARLEAERLEAERARLEALINQIMSEDVYFDFDRSELTETVTIEGHTDARGTEDYNFTLGAKRAMKVKEFLSAYGIEGKRMESVSYGKEAPKAQGETEEAYSQNRRANFRVNIVQQ